MSNSETRKRLIAAFAAVGISASGAFVAYGI